MEEWFGHPFTDPDFEEKHITRIPVTIAGGKSVTIACHVAIAARMMRVFQHLKSENALPLIKTYDGCFNIRKVRGGNRPSLHAWGLAIDLNAGQFPLGSAQRQNPISGAGVGFGRVFQRGKVPSALTRCIFSIRRTRCRDKQRFQSAAFPKSAWDLEPCFF